MGLAYPPSLEEQSSRIAATLTSWIEPRGGSVKQLANATHLWEEVVNETLADTRPKVRFWFDGEKAKGSPEKSHKLYRVVRSWRVAVVRGHGWKNLVAESDATQGESFLAAMESLREVIRTQDDVTESPPVDYASLSPLPNIAPGKAANIFLDSFQIQFSTENDIPGIDTGNQ